MTHLHTPEVIQKREMTKRRNYETNVRLQQAKEYKEEHGINTRPKVVYREVVVYVPSRSESHASISRARSKDESFNVDSVLSATEQDWLRQLVHREGTTPNGALFLRNFCERLEEEYEKRLTPAVMRQCLHAIGCVFSKLEPGYYMKGSRDEKNVKRRARIVPLANYVYGFGPKMVMWNFDEAPFYVKDFRKAGWIDASLPDSNVRAWLQAGGQKGKRINVSAFISRHFGVLYDDVLDAHVGALDTDGTKNDAARSAEVFRWAADVLSRRYPGMLHVILTDSPRIHCAMPLDAVNPEKINLNDGGKARTPDRLFGSKCLVEIFGTTPELSHFDTTNWRKDDYRKKLWQYGPVKEQLMELEEILWRKGHLLLFNPVAHPWLAPIELFWRDIKWSYRTTVTHTESALVAHLTDWLSRRDDEFQDLLERYFRTSRAYNTYYLSGGTERITERKLKRLADDHFDGVAKNPAQTRRDAMQALYTRAPNLPRTPEAKKTANLEEVRRLLHQEMHEVNWLRKKHGQIGGFDDVVEQDAQ